MRKLTWIALFLLSITQLAYSQTHHSKLNGIFQTSSQGITLPFYNNNDKSLTIDNAESITFDDFKKVTTRSTQYGKVILINLNKKGKAMLAKMTKQNLQKPLVIVFRGKILSAPIVHEAITGGRLEISGIDKKTISDILKFINK
jgi:preprotein translocase subunit SecD